MGLETKTLGAMQEQAPLYHKRQSTVSNLTAVHVVAVALVHMYVRTYVFVKMASVIQYTQTHMYCAPPGHQCDKISNSLS